MSINSSGSRFTNTGTFARLFSRIDANGSGDITKKELKGHLKNIGAPSGPFGVMRSKAASALLDQFDGNRNGRITRDEFEQNGRILLPAELQGAEGLEKANALFAKWDKDGSAQLDYHEVKAGIRGALSSGAMRDTKAEIGARLAIDALDDSRDGGISLDELRHAVRSAQRV